MTLAVVFILILVVLVIAVVVAGVMLATGNKPLGSDDVTPPTSPPAGPGAEGMRVSGPGDIAPGPPSDESEDR